MPTQLPTTVRILCAALAPLFAIAALGASEEAPANGSWTVEGQKSELRHARAFREPDPFGRGTNPCVLLSNEAVPDEAVPDDDEGVGELLDRMRAGTLRALQVCFEAGGQKLRSINDVATFHPGVSPGRFTLQGFHAFTSRPAGGRIAGRLTGAGTTSGGGAWSVEAELSVAMPAE